MNKIKVELFDADGTLVKKEEKHNYVTDGYLQQIENYARQFIGANFSVAGYIGIVSNMGSLLVLTNNSDAIDTTKQQFDDALVGFAYSSGSTGTESKRGNLNVAESFASNASIKLVFDFATDRANGTFQTLHFTNAINDPMSKAAGSIPALSTSSSLEDGYTSSEYFNGLCSDGTYIYSILNTTTIVKYNQSNYSFVSEIPLSAALGSFTDITTDGTHFYITSGSSNIIYKYLLNGTYVTQVTYAHDCDGITRIGTTLYTNDNQNLYSLSTSLGASTFLGSMLSASISYLCTDGTDIFAGDSSRLYKVSTVDASEIETYGSPSILLSGIEYKDASTLIVSYQGFGELDIGNAHNVLSRARLDSAVTKNNTQTMKVTYTFNFS